MAEHGTEPPTVGAVSPTDWLATARDVVYNDAGELILPNQIGAALEEYGVDVSRTIDGIPAFEDVPREIPLTACLLSVELREDPAVFILGRTLARYS